LTREVAHPEDEVFILRMWRGTWEAAHPEDVVFILVTR